MIYDRYYFVIDKKEGLLPCIPLRFLPLATNPFLRRRLNSKPRALCLDKNKF